MSSHYEWGTARGGLYGFWQNTDLAAHDLQAVDPIDGPAVLGLFNDNGDGLVLEGTAEEVRGYVDLLHASVHNLLDDPPPSPDDTAGGRERVHNARNAIRSLLRELRYSAGCSQVPNPAPDTSEAAFLETIGAWLVEFSRVLVTVSDTNTEMAHDLNDLRTQRSAIRQFLGLDSLLNRAVSP